MLLGHGRPHSTNGAPCGALAAHGERMGCWACHDEHDEPGAPPRELTISSASNPRLKGLLALRRRRTREETGQTLVEGYEEIGLALSAGVRPGTVYVCEELFSPAGRAGSQDIGHQADLLARLRARPRRGRPPQPAAPSRRSATARDPTGCIAVVGRIGVDLADLHVDGPDHLTLLSQGVEKPGNLGAMLRTADAAGVDAVDRGRPRHRLGQPQRRAREQGHRLRRARRERDDRRGARRGSPPTRSASSSPPPRPTCCTPTSTTPVVSPSPSAARSTAPTGPCSTPPRTASGSPCTARRTASTSPRRPRSCSTRRFVNATRADPTRPRGARGTAYEMTVRFRPCDACDEPAREGEGWSKAPLGVCHDVLYAS